ncbi:MAG: MarR family transcriptional regulator [Roseibium sp.]|uniref:MarR family winged helix-turn-helix transcriptional regulator n=1 Tax=Roseibium sp. TaxID=1936156 RepID=UPI0026118C87|nr:MarR family transcriptional regulator [Roseibium sp.]MCV0427316.1 MarR family transcriptional regulator [Roseibium sp.]
MVEDVVRTLGYATLGSRLKRIGEKLQSQTQELASRMGATDLPASHHPVLASLDRHGPLSIGELAKALGQSQPGVTRMANKMKTDGLVETLSDGRDKRVNQIALTEKGRTYVDLLKQTLWPATAFLVQGACEELSGPLLTQLAQLEDALADQPLSKRLPNTPVPDWDQLVPSKNDKKRSNG